MLDACVNVYMFCHHAFFLTPLKALKSPYALKSQVPVKTFNVARIFACAPAISVRMGAEDCRVTL